MTKHYLTLVFAFVIAFVQAQTVLFNYNFQSALPSGITANYNGGSLSTTKTADGVCSTGAATINAGGNLQVSIASCNVFRVNMKSTGSGARTVTVKYKLQTDVDFTTLTTSLSVQAAASFDFHTLYPSIVSTAPITVSIEPTSGNIQIHDLYVESNNGASNAAEITAFSIPNQLGNAVINSAAATVSVNVPLGTDLTAVTPSTLNISFGASINPTATTPRNFSSPVTYTVTAQDGTSTKVWTVTVTPVASTEKEITAFQLAANQIDAATINSAAGTIAVSMPTGTNLTSIVPQTLTISANATISPLPSVARDFSSPLTYTVTAQDASTKTWTITVSLVAPTYTLTINKTGTGNVSANPAPTNGVYTEGTVVTLTATPLAGASFINWTGDASGTNTTTTVTMTANKTVTANFTSSYTFDFNQVVGFASIAGDGFAGPTIGGNNATQPVLCINGPADFNKLCESLYNRGRVWAGRTQSAGTVPGTNQMLKQPLIILIKAGTYNASQTLSTVGGNAYGNDMLDIAEQGDITFIGEGNVVFNFGINVKRSYNVIIRNISFHSYGDDGVNVGYPETHHIWIDHCTFGHPTTLPSNTDTPDGTSEVKDGASYVTISWCKYQNHWKTCLMGHSDNNGGTDAGRLKVTYYANYFYSTNSRHPRTRFGTAHVLNNMYENVGLGRTGHFGYGIGASNNSQVWAEGNFFLDTRWPMLADRSTADFAAVYGSLLSPNSNIQCWGLKSVNNEYDDSGLTQSIVGQVKADMINPSGKSVKFDELITPNFTFNPANDYNYTALPASAVRTLIPQYAGADIINWNVSCSVIALDLIDFKVEKNTEASASVRWTTANEQAVSHFEIEKSADGHLFSAVGTVKATNNKTLNTYLFTDNTPLSIVQYYRLKMVDLDGSITYSKVLSLSNDKSAIKTLKITPSVSNDMITIEIPQVETATLTVVDVLGRAVFSKKMTATDAQTAHTLSVAPFVNGLYTVVLTNGQGQWLGKFLKQ
ncbi:MAG: DUF5018 domain-containing protein [Saprospiraceae bacterium]|nr:DUF5018 domain-containing protein [Saprospiraceae bacterium]